MRYWHALPCMLLATGYAASAAAQSRDSAATVPVFTTLRDSLVSTTSHTVTASYISRSPRVGATRYQERVTPFTWEMTSPHVAAGISAAPFHVTSGTVAFAAQMPVTAHLDLAIRAGDSLSVYARTSSTPLGLDSVYSNALGAVNSAVLDLASQWLALPSQVGVRGSITLPLGPTLLNLAAAAEHDTRPRISTGYVYFTGTTLRGTATLSASLRDGPDLSAWISTERSQADSLGGRNLFPGGGSTTVGGDLDGTVGASAVKYAVEGTYTTWYGATRNDQPNQAVLIGPYGGITGTLTIPIGSGSIAPSVAWLTESGSADVMVGQGPNRRSIRLSSGGHSVTGRVLGSIPLLPSLTLQPEVSVIGGGFSWTTPAASTVIRRGRPVPVAGSTGITRQSLSGVVFGIGLQASF